MGKNPHSGAAQVLVAQVGEPVALSRRKRGRTVLADDASVGLDEIARAFEMWSRQQDDEDELRMPRQAAPDFASTINSHAAVGARPEAHAGTVSVFVVGDERALELVGRGSTARSLRFRRSRTENLRRAREAIITSHPDLIVVDIDVPRAKELVVRLLGDPRTERIPLLVMGTFALQEEMDDYVALGAVRAFDKPVPVAVFRAACADALDADDDSGIDDEDDLRNDPRLPHIIPVPPPSRPVAAAIAPSASLSLTPPSVNTYALAHVPAPRSTAMVRSSLAPLTGRRVLVADADPATVALIGNAFRSAGCIVEETSLGESALRAALGRTITPDLVIVEAPEDSGPVDGVALCEAMRGDVAARDVPVLLLCDADEPDDEITCSGANAVLSKAVSLKTLMSKAGELVTKRAILEERLRTQPQTSGKLRDLSVRTLLASTSETHARATVRLEDDSFVHTIFLENGKVKGVTRVSRTEPDGHVESGRRAMATALSMRRGTYTVTPCDPLDDPENADLFADTLEAMRSTAKTLARARTEGEREPHARSVDASVKSYADAVVQELASRGFVLEPPVAKPVAEPPVDNALTDPAPPVISVTVTREPAPAPVPPPVAAPPPRRVAHPEAVFVAAPAVSATPAAPAAPISSAAPIAPEPVVAVEAPAPAPVMAPLDAAPMVPMPVTPLAPAMPIASETLLAARARRTQILRAAAVAVLAIALGATGRWRMKNHAHPTAALPATAAMAAPAAPAPLAADKGNSALPPEGTAEITAAADTTIVIDGVERGHGPQFSVTLPIGIHALRSGIDARSRNVQITRGRVTHVDLTAAQTAATPLP